MSRKLRVLVIEDLEDDVLLLLRELRKGGYEPDYECIDTEAAMKSVLHSREWDIIICDFNMPSFRGDHALSLLKESGLDVPFILLSGTIGERIAVDMMKAGANDYIMKKNMTRLVPAIQRELHEAKIRQEGREAEVALQQSEEKYRTLLQSMHDLVFVHDVHDRYVQYYTSSKGLLFVPPEEFIGRHVRDVLPPDVAEQHLKSMQRVRKSGESETFDYALEFGGQEYWFSNIMSVHEDGESIVSVVRDITERKQAEESLRESEERLHQVFNLVPHQMFVKDSEGRFILLNEAVAESYGVAVDAIIGQKQMDIHPDPRQAEKFLQEDAEVLKTGRQLRIPDELFAHPDGTVSWLDTRKIPIQFGDHGTCVLGVAQDITDRKRAEEALRESEEWFRAIYEESPIAINVFDLDGNLVHANPALLNFVGVSSVEDLKDFNIFRDPNMPEDAIQRMRKGERVRFQSVIDYAKAREAGLYDTSKSGVSYVEAGTSPLKYGDDESLHGYMVQMVDATDRVLAEKKVRISEERYRGLVERMNEVVFRISVPDGKYEYMSPSVGRLGGYEAKEFLDSPLLIMKMVHPDSLEYFMGKWAEMVESKVDPVYEYKIIDTSGNTKWVSQSNAPVYDEKGNLIALEGNCRDITDRKKAEEDMRTAAETAMLYLDLMGHDIRNHLQAIIMGTEILEQLDIRPEVREMVDLVVDSVENSQNLIKKVQATRELLSVPLSSIPLKEALEDCLQVLNETYDDVQIEVDLAAQQPNVFADKYLGNLLMNILENAILHNDKKKKRIWLGLKEVEGGYEVVVADNGPGIDNDTKENLFDQSRRFGGVGVHQAFKIAQKYGGQISVQDRVPGDSNKGAEFHIWFPKSTA